MNILKYKHIRSGLFFLFFLSVSFFSLCICSKTSFFYPVQNWADSNCFFTTAKSMANGYVLYKDIFEQKGLLLYLLHIVGYYISNTNFVGVFLIQVVFFTAFLMISYKIFRLFFNSRMALTLIPILALLLLISLGYCEGDSAEEFCLPLLAAGLYIVLKYFSYRSYRPVPLSLMFLCGVMCGCILWIKYTILGFWIGFVITIICMCIYHRRIADIFKYAAVFAAGTVLVTVLCLSYFIATDSVKEMFDTYFVLNIVGYSPNSGETNIFIKLISILWEIIKGMGVNYIIAILTIVGFVAIFANRHFPFIHNKPCKVCLLVMYLSTLFFAYIGGRSWNYYYLCADIFVLLGLVALGYRLRRMNPKRLCRLLKNYAFYPTTFALCLLLCIILSPNTGQIGLPKELTTQYVFSSYINQRENASLLNYGCLDGGFYTVANKLPVTKYFCNLNIPYESYPQMLDEQNRIIREKKVDFVIICTDENYPTAEEIPCLIQNYRLVRKGTTKENYTGNYDLYEKI